MANAMTGGVSYKIRVIQQHSLSQKSKIFAGSLREGAKAASPQNCPSNWNLTFGKEERVMKKNVRWITHTAVMLALLICLQWVGSFIPEQMTKQLITGTMVNCVLAVTALLVGMSAGVTVAIISPVCAFVLGIAPNLITVLPIMLGNVCYVVLLKVLMAKPLWRQVTGLVAAAVAKFAVLYVLVVGVICGVASGILLGQKLGQTVLLAPPMLKMLPAMFTWPQLITALVGGALALMIYPVVKKGAE